jgi:AcrR family transcriptional regulator
VKQHGLTDFSLRPLAKAIGSSPRVLLFLFESKDGLVRALLARARSDELAFLTTLSDDSELASRARAIWSWLAAPEHAALLGLWTEAYARSLLDQEGPWRGFARETVEDWLALLSRDSDTRQATLILAVLRGAMLDLLATGDRQRTTAAVELALSHTARRPLSAPQSWELDAE